MKTIFMGTPDIAASILKTLCESRHTVAAVITQPDKPKGRGYELTPPPVKVFALENGIPVYQPTKMKDGTVLGILEKYQPDALVVAAYGRILPEDVLNFPKYGAINVHASLLPKYRGAAPIQRAIIDGEKETGITIMKMDAGLDTGDMILKKTTPITDADNFETLHDRLAEIGGEAITEALDLIESGKAVYEKQDSALSNYAEKITKDDCRIDFTKTARELFNMIRGLSPVPLACCCMSCGKILKIISARLADDEDKVYAEPGRIISLEDGVITVACGKGALEITAVLPEGKKRMCSADFIRGARDLCNERLARN